eukprot:501365_1
MGNFIWGTDGWCFFHSDSGKWKYFAPETTKEIDRALKQAWHTSPSTIISFPVTKGEFFEQHQGTFFCRIGLNKKRTHIIECILINTKKDKETPMKREPEFRVPYKTQNRRNNNYPKPSHNNQNYHGRQVYHNQPQVRVEIKSAHGTTVEWMTPEQANYYTYVMMENASVGDSGSIVPHNSHNDNDMNVDDDDNDDQDINIVHAYDYKNINDWTCNELQERIISLHLQ